MAAKVSYYKITVTRVKILLTIHFFKYSEKFHRKESHGSQRAINTVQFRVWSQFWLTDS